MWSFRAVVSAFLMLWPFNIIPHVVVTPSYNNFCCYFTTVMNYTVHIWYAVYLLCDPQGVNDPQVKKHCLACTINMCYLKCRSYIHSVLYSINACIKHKVHGSIKSTLLLKLLTILLNFNLLGILMASD